MIGQAKELPIVGPCQESIECCEYGLTRDLAAFDLGEHESDHEDFAARILARSRWEWSVRWRRVLRCSCVLSSRKRFSRVAIRSDNSPMASSPDTRWRRRAPGGAGCLAGWPRAWLAFSTRAKLHFEAVRTKTPRCSITCDRALCYGLGFAG
jgi:hypothetical protein